MGNFLASPITDKETHRGEGNGLRYGISAMQGWRTNMEDSHIAVLEPAKLPEGNAVFAVCDGHGGKFAAIEAEKLMVDVFGEVMAEESFGVAKTNPSPEAIGSAMREAFMRLDDRIRSKPEVQYGSDQSGCTAISAIVTPEHIIVANAGDSRSVLGKDGRTVAMSEDHKPMNITERTRIEKAGGIVRMNRVNGDLAVSRSLGDFTYKQRKDLGAHEQQVSAEPDIKIEPRDGSEEFLLIACDGIWDVMSNDEICAYVRDLMNKGERDVGLIAEEILDNCLRLGSRDNMSVVLVMFPAAKYGEGEGVAGVRQERAKADAEAEIKAREAELAERTQLD